MDKNNNSYGNKDRDTDVYRYRYNIVKYTDHNADLYTNIYNNVNGNANMDKDKYTYVYPDKHAR
jgi:hypothetical protein